MLLPVLNSARTTAKTKICLSTQKQLGVLYFSYMTDYSDLLPPARTCQGTIYWSWWGIRRVVHSYIPYKGGMPAAYKDKVLRCSEGSLRKQDGHTTIDQHYGQIYIYPLLLGLPVRTTTALQVVPLNPPFLPRSPALPPDSFWGIPITPECFVNRVLPNWMRQNSMECVTAMQYRSMPHM